MTIAERNKSLRFPLYERAERLGILDGRSALIVAPTATGKSHIGREAVRRALQRQEGGTHAYLVPFRALATEIFETFLDALAGSETRVRILTGDHRDPLRPDQADLIVATYESFAGLLQNSSFRPDILVADEVHLIADDSRGPVVEGLFARLLASGRLRALIALSAAVENPGDLARWLNIPLLEGSVEDRPVDLSLEHVWFDNVEETLRRVLKPCRDGEQGLVFCSSRPAAEKTARQLTEFIKDSLSHDDRKALADVAARILEDDPDADNLAALVPSGVGYHHAGLTRAVRRHVEQAFRERRLRILTGTTTLAAGVNLPAGITAVKDVFRSEAVRGTFQRILLPTGELLNMLGRAARPHLVQRGTGVVLIDRRFQHEPEVKALTEALRAGRGSPVFSRLPESFDGLMRFVLAVVTERGEATREDITEAFSRTLAYHADPRAIDFGRSFEEDMMEDLPAYKKVVEADGTIYLDSYWLSLDGVHARVKSSENAYEVKVGITGVECSCPAASRFYRARGCKHQACAIHDLLFQTGIDPEARYRTIYNCGHVFGAKLDAGTRIGQAVEILMYWRLLERVPGGWRATPVGRVATTTNFDLLFVHQAVGRVMKAKEADYQQVASWAVEDHYFDAPAQGRWKKAVSQWLGEVDLRKIQLPTRYRGDFEQAVEELARVCGLYEKAAFVVGKTRIAEASRMAAGALRYGVAPELVPLMALGLPQLARARSRYLHDRGIRNLQDLAGADPRKLSDPRRAPEALVRLWVERAQEIYQARAVATADRQEAEAEFDELVARFRLDPAALS